VGPSRALLGNHRVFMAWPKMDARLAAKHLARGFTLIEIAIVIVVIGLLVGGGLTAISPVIQSARLSETKQKMATVDSAVLGYIITNGCLPCPAARNIGGTPTGLSNDGADQLVTAPCATDQTCLGAADAAGLVPWVTLGLSQDDVTDGFGRMFTFAVDGELTNANTDMQRSNGTFPTLTGTNIVIQNLTVGAPVDFTYNSLAYVLVSHGPDGSFGQTLNATRLANLYNAPANEGQNENGDDNDIRFATGSVNFTNGTAYFDDIVNFRSLQAVILSCGSGSCGNPS
jgi:prepilin-type N-terminal cleavage/methylation domain-containing protein